MCVCVCVCECECAIVCFEGRVGVSVRVCSGARNHLYRFQKNKIWEKRRFLSPWKRIAQDDCLAPKIVHSSINHRHDFCIACHDV